MKDERRLPSLFILQPSSLILQQEPLTPTLSPEYRGEGDRAATRYLDPAVIHQATLIGADRGATAAARCGGGRTGNLRQRPPRPSAAPRGRADRRAAFRRSAFSPRRSRRPG